MRHSLFSSIGEWNRRHYVICRYGPIEKKSSVVQIFTEHNKYYDVFLKTSSGLNSRGKANDSFSYLLNIYRKYVNTNNRVAEDNPERPLMLSIFEHNSWIVTFSLKQISANDSHVSRSKRMLVLLPLTMTFLQRSIFFPFQFHIKHFCFFYH